MSSTVHTASTYAAGWILWSTARRAQWLGLVWYAAGRAQWIGRVWYAAGRPQWADQSYVRRCSSMYAAVRRMYVEYTVGKMQCRYGVCRYVQYLHHSGPISVASSCPADPAAGNRANPGTATSKTDAVENLVTWTGARGPPCRTVLDLHPPGVYLSASQDDGPGGRYCRQPSIVAETHVSPSQRCPSVSSVGIPSRRCGRSTRGRGTRAAATTSG